MRRDWRERHPSSMFRGAERMRLITAVLMLVVLYLLITQARNVDAWRWLAPEEPKVAQGSSQEPPKKLPDATGPTDEDSDQEEEAKNEFQAITDGSLTLGPEEMEPYDRLVFWVKNQSYARLRQRARSNLLFTHLHDEPDKYRGQVVSMELTVRRILDAGKNRDGIQLYEVWGVSAESRDRLYVAIVVDLPKGMPIGASVHEKSRFVGYFFKLQGYHASGAKLGAVPEKTPLLIGRLQWEPVAVPKVNNTWDSTVGLSLLVIFGLVLGLGMIYSKWYKRKPDPRAWIPTAAPGEVIPIEKWLEEANFIEDSRDNRPDGEEEKGQ
jgi:hypothetical protein